MVEQAQEGAPLKFAAGEYIFEHVLDSQVIELRPFGEIHLPTLRLGPVALPITRHVVMMWAACVVIGLLVWLASRRRSMIPHGIRNVLEAMVVFVRDDLARKNIPHHADRFVPYLASTFLFILVCNLLGLLPYAATPTGNISVTAGLAGVAFLMIQGAGIRENGIAGHLKNLAPHGIPKMLLPIMVLVEFIGMFVKPFALCVRLFANMTGGHIVIAALVGLVFVLERAWVGATLSVPFSVFIEGIEILVAFLQAYIFTMLTSLFIGMSAHPQH